MEPVAISWLVASAISPLIAVLSLWTVYVFHTYRRRWRTVDLFLLAVAVQELITSIFIFSYTIVSLINPSVLAICSFIQWGLVSTRTFQVTTLTSMVVDRALTVRWPYRYRFSVRRNQIRYHIAVLAMVSSLVGVASVFARASENPVGPLCSGHPLKWDLRFIVFILGFYSVLVFVSLACTVQIEVHKCRHNGNYQDCANGPFQVSDYGPPPEVPVISPLDNESHTGSTKALHRPHRHSSRRPYEKRGTSPTTFDFRWPPVAVVSLLCYSLNHLPFVVLSSLATALPWLWSPWHEAVLAWLRLGEGVLVPVVLTLMDNSLRCALKRTFQRRSGTLSPLVGDDGPFQMYFDKDHFRKRGTFGSVTPIGIITNYRRTPGKKRRQRKTKYKLPGLYNGDSVIEKSCLSSSFLSTEPLSKLSCADLTTLEVWQEEEEENFYATLSDDFSSYSGHSADDHCLTEGAKISEELYGGSFTTIANDDFEFHDTRPCGGEVRMKPTNFVSNNNNNNNNSLKTNSTYGYNSGKTDIKSDMEKRSSLDKVDDLMMMTLPSEDDFKDSKLFQITEVSPSEEEKPENIDEENDKVSNEKAVPSRKLTSLSMNDLDLIGEGKSEEERIIMLPVKSESTLSLYKLQIDHAMEQLLPVTQSETNINIDSGFGSGTKAVNPPFFNHPSRKVSDPLWNLRKPVSSSSSNISWQYPCILHSKMKKIPWISAWRKLEGSRKNIDVLEKIQVPTNLNSVVGTSNENFECRPKSGFYWKNSAMYGMEESSKQNIIDCNQSTRNPLYDEQWENVNYSSDINTNRKQTANDMSKSYNLNRDNNHVKDYFRQNNNEEDSDTNRYFYETVTNDQKFPGDNIYEKLDSGEESDDEEEDISGEGHEGVVDATKNFHFRRETANVSSNVTKMNTRDLSGNENTEYLLRHASLKKDAHHDFKNNNLNKNNISESSELHKPFIADKEFGNDLKLHQNGNLVQSIRITCPIYGSTEYSTPNQYFSPQVKRYRSGFFNEINDNNEANSVNDLNANVLLQNQGKKWNEFPFMNENREDSKRKSFSRIPQKESSDIRKRSASYEKAKEKYEQMQSDILKFERNSGSDARRERNAVWYKKGIDDGCQKDAIKRRKGSFGWRNDILYSSDCDKRESHKRGNDLERRESAKRINDTETKGNETSTNDPRATQNIVENDNYQQDSSKSIVELERKSSSKRDDVPRKGHSKLPYGLERKHSQERNTDISRKESIPKANVTEYGKISSNLPRKESTKKVSNLQRRESNKRSSDRERKDGISKVPQFGQREFVKQVNNYDQKQTIKETDNMELKEHAKRICNIKRKESGKRTGDLERKESTGRVRDDNNVIKHKYLPSKNVKVDNLEPITVDNSESPSKLKRRDSSHKNDRVTQNSDHGYKDRFDGGCKKFSNDHSIKYSNQRSSLFDPQDEYRKCIEITSSHMPRDEGGIMYYDDRGTGDHEYISLKAECERKEGETNIINKTEQCIDRERKESVNRKYAEQDALHSDLKKQIPSNLNKGPRKIRRRESMKSDLRETDRLLRKKNSFRDESNFQENENSHLGRKAGILNANIPSDLEKTNEFSDRLILDNLDQQYSRLENGNSIQKEENFPFEALMQPQQQLITNHVNSSSKELSSKQKKIAVTDYL